jgi:hypothetical protein
MSHITLTEEQSQVIEQAQEVVEVRDRRGNVVAHIIDARTAEHIAKAKQNRASKQPRYPASQVQARLQALAEAVEREGLNEEQALALLKRMRAEGKP